MYFQQLHSLRKHISTLVPVLGTAEVFIVGGAIRDILLGIASDPTDIDLTLVADPETLRQHIEKENKEKMSCFRTDKYGTITLINKDKQTYEYEITPFRVEGQYTDVRHPEDITRSDSLLEDSKRRDFTINCLYRYSNESMQNIKVPSKENKQIKNKEQLLNIIKKKSNIYLSDSKTIIISDHNLIEKLFPKGVFQQDAFQEVIQDLPIFHFQDAIKKIPETSYPSLLIDPQGGLVDLLTQTIRTVGIPDDRFQEDALRILRGVRFPNILNQYLPDKHKQNEGFLFEKTTRASMLSHAKLIENLAKERIHQELVKVFSANNPFGYMALLDELGLVERLFPALAKCKHNVQPTLYHPFDTYVHTLLTLEALQKINTHYLAKLAMLYHDVGKPDQYAYISEQKEKNPDDIDMSDYIHHTETGVSIAKKDFKELGFSKKEIEEMNRYIRRHHRPGEILASNDKNQLKKTRKLLSEGGLERTLHLIDVAIADRSGQFNPLQPAAVEELYDMKETIQELHKNEGRFTIKELAIDGSILMKELQLEPGPDLGTLLQKAFDRVLGDLQERNTKKNILVYLKSL